MLEQTLKSSCLFEQSEKLHVDFERKLSMSRIMVDIDQIDPQKARSGLFALVTARLEDAHELAVRGQRREIDQAEVLKLLDDLIDQTNQIEILLKAIGTIRE